MYKNRPVFLTTGPSVFSPEIQKMVEQYFGGIAMYCNNYKKEDLDYFIDSADYAIFAGGTDYFPGLLNRNVEHNQGYTKFNIRRDLAEIYLMDKMIELGKSCLFICRGAQICLAKKFGFYLLEDIGGSVCHHPGEIKIDYENGEFCHFVSVLPKFRDIYGFTREGCQSWHHEGIYWDEKTVEQNGIDIVAVADTHSDKKRNTKIIEIAESQDLKILMAQMHPEADVFHGNVVSNKVLERFKSFLG